MGEKAVELTPAVLTKLAKRLPTGYDVANVRLIRASATIIPAATPDTLESAFLAQLETAGGVPMITGGKPTIMRVVAWVAHEGVNRNRLAFVAEDLVEAAAKIQAPNILPMDFNHSALNSWTMEQAVIGAWYSAEYATDPQARAPRGPGGLLARGVVWSALFPEYSTRLLAEQARNGFIEFSMACIPEWTEVGSDADGDYEIARKPVFFTFSALDIEPGDPDAKGFGEEGSSEADLEAQFTRELTHTTAAKDILETLRVFVASSNRKEVTDMDPVQAILEFLKANANTLASQETLVEVQAKLEGLMEIVKQPVGLTAEQAAKIASLEGRVQELETALSAAETQLAAADKLVKELEAKVAEQDTKLAEVAAAEADAAKVVKLQERLASLPEHILAAHTAQEDEKRKLQEARWADKSDAEWQEVLDTFALIPAVQKASFLKRSEAEGVLPNARGGSALESLAKFR